MQNLIGNWKSDSPTRPKLVINDWAHTTAKEETGRIWFRLTTIIDSTGIALLKSLATAPIRLKALSSELNKRDVKLVNFHYTDHAPAGIATLKKLNLYRGSLIISLHGSDAHPPAGPLDAALNRYCHKHADAIVACSKSLATRFLSYYPEAADKVRIIQNGTDASIYRPSAPITKKLKNAVPPEYIIGIGAYNPRKAHHHLVEAFSLVSQDFPSLHLCIAGAAGSETPILTETAAKLGLADRIHLFENLEREDVAGLLAHAKLCVQTSLYESMPLAVLEAGAAGTPLVVTDIPGHRDIICEGTTGRLFPANTPQECARTIRDALREDAKSRRMAETFRARVTSELTWKACLGEYLKLAGIH